MAIKEPTRYWIVNFGWFRYAKCRLIRPMTRHEVDAAMCPEARKHYEYVHGKASIEPVSKRRFYAL